MKAKEREADRPEAGAVVQRALSPSTILFDTHNNSVYEGSYYVHVIDEGLRFSYVSTCPMQHSKQ